MAFTGRYIMEAAQRLLNDSTNVRWSLEELAQWINDGCRAIVLAKPSATAESRVMELEVGTHQFVPNSPAPVPLALLDITRNLKTTATNPRVGGRIVRPTTRKLLDVNDPDWHDSAETAYQAEVRQWIYDEMNPLEFYVYPGNDGNGILEIVVSVTPALLAPTGSVLELASWETTIALPDPYSTPLIDYVLYRAQIKDDDGANAQRAMAHYQSFANALGLKAQVDMSIEQKQKD